MIDFSKFSDPTGGFSYPGAKAKAEDAASSYRSGSPSGGGAAGANSYAGALGGGITMPDAWTKAKQYWEAMMGGSNLAGGGLSGEAMTRLRTPTDVSGLWGKYEPLTRRMIDEEQKNAMEQAGMGGMRQSTVASTQLGDIANKYWQQQAANIMQQEIAAKEAAAGRDLSAELGSGQMGTQASIANMQGRMGAAESLFGAGSAENQLAMGLISMLGGFGQQQENPAWMQWAMQAYPQGMSGMPQTYQPSFWEQMAGSIPGLMNLFSGQGGGGMNPGQGRNTSSWQQPSSTYGNERYWG